MLPVGIQNNIDAILAQNPNADPVAILLSSGNYFVAFFGDVTDGEAVVNGGYYKSNGAQVGKIAQLADIADATQPLSLEETDGFPAVSYTSAEGEELVAIVGDSFRDDIDGTDADELIQTFRGPDFVDAGAGDDEVYTGDGADTVNAGDGNDYVEGGSSGDIIRGEAGNDTLLGQEGGDEITGGEGDDLIYGGDFSDRLLGQEGDDTILTTTSYVGKIWLLRSAGHGASGTPDALPRLPRRALPSRNDLFHSKHRVRTPAALTVLNTRSQIPSRRPEHYLRGQQAASTAHQREVLPPGLTPSKKGR